MNKPLSNMESMPVVSKVVSAVGDYLMREEVLAFLGIKPRVHS